MIDGYVKTLLEGVRRWTNSKLEDTSYVVANHICDLTYNVSYLDETKQHTLTPGNNVQISNSYVISAVDTVYHNGDNVSIDGSNNINARGYKWNEHEKTFLEGYTTDGDGYHAHAEGYYTYVHGGSSHAEGAYTTTYNMYAHAEGYYTLAYARNTHAEGAYTTAYGKCSHVEGAYVTSYGEVSHVEGSYTVTYNKSEHAQGNWNKSHALYEYVDLGLASGILWARYNIGATHENTRASWIGSYFQWGDVNDCSTKDCTYNDYIYGGSERTKVTKYCQTDKTSNWEGEGEPDNITYLEKNDDAAYVNWGGGWHVPSKENFNELFELPYEYVHDYNGIEGLDGAVFYGANDEHLFIPGAGYRIDGEWSQQTFGAECHYWANEIEPYPDFAYFAFMYSGNIHTVNDSARYTAKPIRPVTTRDELKDLVTLHSIGIGTGENDRRDAVEVMNNGDVFIKGVGGYDGTNPDADNVLPLQSVIDLTMTTKADKESVVEIEDGGSASSQALSPNTLYVFTTRTNNLTLTLTAGETGKVNEYHLFITTGATAPTITWPIGLSWNGGDPPTITANMTYEISILNNIAIYIEV